MHYQISRNGQMYGPYTIEDLERYVASGNILPTDMAKSETMTDWLPVSQVLAGRGAGTEQTQGDPAASGFTSPGFANPDATGYMPVAGAGMGAGAASAAGGNAMANMAASPYPDAPNLHWGLVLLFTVLTCGLFMPIWNLVVSAWLKRVQPNSIALYLYIGVAVLWLIHFMVGGMLAMTTMSHVHDGVSGIPHLAARGSILSLNWLLRLFARYSERASLQEHFNTVEPIGLDLNPIMTFFFGGLYFQSQLNRINAMKQAARFGAGRAF